MAETAKILSPDKTVLIPDPQATCPMARMVDAAAIRELKAENPSAKTLCYVNTSAEVKAECDLCCTSANAVKMVSEGFSSDQKIIFVPDKYLSDYVARVTKRNIIPWSGYCPTHVKIMAEDILKQKKKYPNALVLAHPECNAEVLELADMVSSTAGMCKFAKQTKAQEMIIATETGMLYRLQKENPQKVFYPATDRAICPNMKKTTLETVLNCLKQEYYQVNVEEGVSERARKSIETMLNISSLVTK